MRNQNDFNGLNRRQTIIECHIKLYTILCISITWEKEIEHGTNILAYAITRVPVDHKERENYTPNETQRGRAPCS